MSDAAIREAETLARRGGDAVASRAYAPFYEAVAGKDVVSFALAGVAYGLVALDAERGAGPFDPISGGLRVLLLVALLRAGLAALRTVAAIRRQAALRTRAIVLLPDHLVVTGANGLALPRSVVVGAFGCDAPSGPVVLVARSDDAPLVVSLPHGANAEVCAVRIERYARESAPSASVDVDTTPSRNPSADFDRIARGETRPFELAVSTSLRFLELGPYAAAVCAVVLAERLIATGEPLAMPPSLLAVTALCTAVPFVWGGMVVRRLRAMGGAALVLTPAEWITRSTAGIHRIRHADLAGVQVHRKRSWTLLTGMTLEGSLTLERLEGAPIRFDERLIALPVEAVAWLAERYRGAASETPASHGSGAGGGISSTEGTQA